MYEKFISIILIAFAFCSCGNNEHFDKQTYNQNKESLADKEKNSPLSFLQVSGENRKNLFGLGRETVVEGKVTNNATVCSYKNVRVKMLCYNKNKMVEEHEDVIDDIIKPASTKDFKTRYRLPKGTDSIALSIMSAVSLPPAVDKK